MALTNQQIDRYSRQIIVSGMGGLGQERLLGSRLMLAGSIGAIEPVLAYMVGAGVGAIRVRTGGSDSAALKRLADRMRGLNSDVAVDCFAGEPDGLSLDGLSLIMVLAAEAEDPGIVRGLRNQSDTPLLFARLDTPARIAIFPSYPPCPVCADADLLAPLADRAEIANFVAMAAATLALKTLASGQAIVPAPTLIEFSGYRTISRPISAHSNAECSCGIQGIS
jgi:hypothetical protein